jgi:dihydrofolate reductase
MGKVRFEISMSLDGYVAGPDQTEDEPLGKGGEALHDWVVALEAWRKSHGHEGGEVNASTPVMEEQIEGFGANLMGRNMFGGGPGPWGDDPWQGWWGDEPPFHHPVFVITHHEREPLTLSDTTFHFVTDGIASALDQAKEAAGDKDVKVSGGANIANQYLAAGQLDEVELHVVPILLGGGSRLFEDLGDANVKLEQNRVVEAPGVTHLRYAVRS